MTHYIGVVASLAIRRSPASTQRANLLLTPARAARIGARGRSGVRRRRLPFARTFSRISHDEGVILSNDTRVKRAYPTRRRPDIGYSCPL
jgi:hypothetical protein